MTEMSAPQHGHCQSNA